MAPSGRIRIRTRSSSSSSTARKTRRSGKTQLKIKQINVGPTSCKKKKMKNNNQEATQNSSSKSIMIIENEVVDNFEGGGGVVVVDNNDVSTCNSGCSTPRGQRFRIPEIVTCPPAPKKQRVVSDCSTFQRSPIAFYAPPDLELFFHFALRGISV